MKIGYPCINRSIGCTANSTFRLASYSQSNLIEKVSNNLECLLTILKYNVLNNMFFFRISSDLVPFASHRVLDFNWQEHFKDKFKEIGNYIKKYNIRISMHPDQFVLINSPSEEIFKKSVADLTWHCEVLDLMKLDETAKVQIHVGGVYGDKVSAMERFVKRYKTLPHIIKKRLVIENDDKLYSLKDCLSISKKIGIPIVFDSFHHVCFNNGEEMSDALKMASETWSPKDGVLMVDYSSQEPNAKLGKHAEHIDVNDFENFLKARKDLDFDIMLEIKDKEKSALKAVKLI